MGRDNISRLLPKPSKRSSYRGRLHWALLSADYFPYAEPIKSNSAEKIANILWKFIFIFQPPRVFMSYQGQEFNNQIVNNVIRRVGSEHVNTSAYHPRTNGQDLIDDKYPTALQNIDKAKSSQIKAQNNKRPVREQ
ncbi:pol poly [Brachionus plicatilis]|uniref:Pol poly n=1 Tax=Brachionus plicatilis TaxID=10195 RepID=A0A3M7QF29_BRAPC|nr:pol poly [Brachionus plicatilis]